MSDDENNRVGIDRVTAAVLLTAFVAVPAGLTVLLFAALGAWGVTGWWRNGITLLIPAWWAYSAHWTYTVLGVPLPWDRRYRRR